MPGVNLKLNRFPTQSDVQSAAHTQNAIDTENGVNDLQRQFDAGLTPPAGSEVPNARDNHSVLRDRLRSGFQVHEKYMVTGGEVTQHGAGDLTVDVAAGEAVVAGVGCIWDAATSGAITAPVTNPRWDTVVINSDNTLSIVTGAELAQPVLPTIASTQKKLAHLYLTPAMTQILTAAIWDGRREMLRETYWGVSEPVGTIKAWHKSLAGVPGLPGEFMECDGSTVADPESPILWQTLPDLNGGARFLKGAATSGTLEASTNKAHTHDVKGGYITPGAGNPPAYVWESPDGSSSGFVMHDVTVPAAALTEGATEALPKNMTVVWIMRIK